MCVFRPFLDPFTYADADDYDDNVDNKENNHCMEIPDPTCTYFAYFFDIKETTTKFQTTQSVLIGHAQNN